MRREGTVKTGKVLMKGTLRSDVDDEEFFLPPLDKWLAV